MIQFIDNDLARFASACRQSWPWLKLLSYAIIYTSQCKVTESWKKFNGCPSYGDIIESKNNGPPKLASRERVFMEERKIMRGWKSKTPVHNKDIKEIIEKNVRTRFVKQYNQIRVRSICKDDTRYYVSVDGEGSNFCLNLNPPRDHKSKFGLMVDVQGNISG